MITYIKIERAKQLSDKDIKAHLLAVGWSEADIDQALSAGMPTTEVNFLKAYRRKKMWKIFGFWAILLLAGLVWSFATSGSPEYWNFSPRMMADLTQFSVLTSLAFCIAYAITVDALPKMGKGPEAWDTIFKAICLFFVETGLILMAFLAVKVLAGI